ncbi:MAG: hypothetical protein CMH83_08235 [Nocardioides sp.]|nr:hypothetical protein [Nocardioides sp.]
MLEPTLAVGGLAATTLALRLRDPHVAGSWGFCPTAAMGFWCPGCGGLRAVNDLTHGRVADAASSNLFLFVAGPFLLAALGWWVLRRWQGRSARPADRTVLVAAAVLVVSGLVFSVLRNGPVPWLAP